MQKHEKQIVTMLQEAGGELIREKKHKVYRLANGRNFVLPSTPGDWRGSRNSLTDLRRFIATAPDATFSLPAAPMTGHQDNRSKQRHRVPNRAPLPKNIGSVAIWDKGTAIAPAPRAAEPKVKQFGSIFELLDAVDQVESYWKLGGTGRTKVLMKLASQFAKVQVIPALYADVQSNMFQLDQLFLKAGKHWEPALLIDDPVEGEMIIEASSLGDDFLLTLPDFTDYGIMVFDRHDDRENKDSPGIRYAFLNSTGMKNRGNFPRTDEFWTNPKFTRQAIRDILDLQASRSALQAPKDRFDIPQASLAPSTIDALFEEFLKHEGGQTVPTPPRLSTSWHLCARRRVMSIIRRFTARRPRE